MINLQKTNKENCFSAEQISKYHPDKYADQISDATLTAYLKGDRKSRVAVETLVKNENVIVAGEVTSEANINIEEVVRKVANKLNYKVSDIKVLLSKQSPEIGNAVSADENIGAGDQGVMFGLAVREKNYMPKAFNYANEIIEVIEKEVENKDSILKGDAKTQVTMSGNLIKTVVVSVCHKEGSSVQQVKELLLNKVLVNVEGLLNENNWVGETFNFIINPAGEWNVGGPTSDCGLTGRKIVCDQYGGFAPVGGGAFSGKDPSKVDRSATYMARKIAKDIIDNFNEVDEVLVQLSYAIGIAEPVGVYVKTDNPFRDDLYNKWIRENYDLTPKGIIESLDLLNIDYEKMAEGCHFYKSEIEGK